MKALFSSSQRRKSAPSSSTQITPSSPLRQNQEPPSSASSSAPAPATRLPPRPPPPPKLSHFSTPAVQNSAWSSLDFMLGAGMVIIQPTSYKIVVVYETEKKFWFLPRGRKDVGESLEQTALREAYEETGYRAQFLPLLNPTHQPLPPEKQDDADWYNTEPIYITVTSWHPRRRRNELHGGEYLTTWYVGQISDEAIPEEGTGMEDEKNFESHLLTFEEAMNCLWDSERLVVAFAWRVFCNTENEKAKSQAPPRPDEEDGSAGSASPSLLVKM